MPTPPIDQDLLARFVPMSALAPSYLRELSNHASVLELSANDTLDEELRMLEFIYYLLDGELCMTGGGIPDTVINAKDSTARFSLAGTETVGRHAKATTPTSLLRLERAKISTLLIWAQASSPETASGGSQLLRDDITALLLQSRLFARIPPSNIERIGQLIEPIEVNNGDVVVRQGDIGDYYYVIEAGRCEVLSEQANDNEPIRLAQLGKGESFGEEALVTDSKRNATVRMTSDGVLLRLTRDYFVELISAPLLHEVSHERAEDLIATGARWIDVRLHEEFERDGLVDAIHVPLGELRSRLAEFPTDGSYITVCNTGRRAQAGAFLLSQRGLHACSLRAGIATRRPEKRGMRAIEKSLGELQTNLLRADAALEEALKAKALADAEQEIETRALHLEGAHKEVTECAELLSRKPAQADDDLRAALDKKRTLESSIRDVQARETSAQRDAQLQVERMRVESQDRLELEKTRLSKHYREASSQLEQVEQARQQAELHFNEERLRIERELDEARRKMDAEAQRIRQAIEQAQLNAERKAKVIRQEHQKLETELRQRTENALRREREHLEEAFSHSIAAHERARQNMELAQAERIEAQTEAARLHAETESELRQRHEHEQQTRDAHVRDLRAKSKSARQRLEQAQGARDEALAQHQRFSSTLTSREQAEDPNKEEALREEVHNASQRLATADTELDQAQQQHAKAAQAEQFAQQTQAAAVGKEDELRLQIFEEMESWIDEEQSRSSEELEQTAQYARQLERIQAEKERKRLEEIHSSENMFSDVEGLLSGQGADDPLNIAMRTHTVAEEKARLIQRARLKIAEDAAHARAALKTTNSDC